MTFNFNTLELKKNNFNSTRLKLSGINVNGVATINKLANNKIVFVKDINSVDEGLLHNLKHCLIITNSDAILETSILEVNDVIITDNPRLTYAIVLQFALGGNVEKKKYKNIGDNIFLGDNVEIGENVYLEPGITIGDNVKIGNNASILSGVRIGDGVILGNDTVIRNNTVIGGCGFGIEKDDRGKTYRIPHLGSVIIGDNVDIGALNTIVSGTIEPTVISDNVMVDDHVHIAHNCHVGAGTLITACVEISGSTKIGRNSMLGPNCSIMNKISLGENTVVGLGAVVTRSFGNNVVLAGNPADTIEKIREDKRMLGEIAHYLKTSDNSRITKGEI